MTATAGMRIARVGIRVGTVALLLAACGARSADDRPHDTQHAPSDSLAAALRAGEFPRTTSVIAYQHDELLTEQYAGDSGVETLHDVRSVTKSLTALATGLALADGKLPSIDAPAFAYPRRFASLCA